MSRDAWERRDSGTGFMGQFTLARLGATASSVFKDREIMFFEEAKGMRVIKLTAARQALMAGAAAALLGYTGVATSVAASTDSADQLAVELTETEAELHEARLKVAAVQNEIALRSALLERRQEFLAKLYDGEANIDEIADAMPKELVGDDLDASASALLDPIGRLEMAQLDLVDEKANEAAMRFDEGKKTLKAMGLNPREVLGAEGGVGGPEVELDGQGGPLAEAEPRFKSLFLNWKKLDLMEKAMAAVPSFRPVKAFTYTSGYGVRFDPFKGTTAMHQGVDMAGPVGEPIYAAGAGTILRAGRNGGYGNFIEIDHGKGMTTRYAHLSRINVKKGDRVAQGEKIGGMGSTGRSTGSHLHYEVRMDGKAVNPMPFLEAAEMASVATNAGAVGGE
ncbi:MAG: M23 family metallopeptidase [Pacificimonas sp.]